MASICLELSLFLAKSISGLTFKLKKFFCTFLLIQKRNVSQKKKKPDLEAEFTNGVERIIDLAEKNYKLPMAELIRHQLCQHE